MVSPSGCAIDSNGIGEYMNEVAKSVEQESVVEVNEQTDVEPKAVDDVPVFRTRDLSVYYGDFRAVRDVNLYIKAREITAFIGPSGCGKSTVLR